MMIFSLLLLLLPVLNIPLSAEACSIFVGSNGRNVLAGNSEDDPFMAEFLNPAIHFNPAQSGNRKYGNMYYEFVGQQPADYPQGGMNTAGLFYDIESISPRKVVYPSGMTPYPTTQSGADPTGELLKHMLDTCATVDEAVTLLHRYQLPGIEFGQLVLADKSGNAAAISVGQNGHITVTKKTDRFFLTTNFDVAYHDYPDSNFPEPRYELAAKLWSQKPQVSMQNFRSLLSALHWEGSTVTIYSNLYDLKNGLMYLYFFHDFADGVKIDLQQELAKGARVVPMQSFFPTLPFAWGNTQQVVNIIACMKSNGGNLAECRKKYPGGLPIPGA